MKAGDEVILTDEGIAAGLIGKALSPRGRVLEVLEVSLDDFVSTPPAVKWPRKNGEVVRGKKIKVLREGIKLPGWYAASYWKPLDDFLKDNELRETVRQCPSSNAAKLVLADYLEEKAGGPTDVSLAFRWMAKHDKRPAFRDDPYTDRWQWWCHAPNHVIGFDKEKWFPASAQLPGPLLWACGNNKWAPVILKFQTEDLAIAALARGLSRLRSLVEYV